MPMHPLYTTVNDAIIRCRDSSHQAYRNYGGRGIRVHPPWAESRKAFIEYILTTLGDRPSRKHQLDRIDNEQGYVPGNLRWATKVENCRNKRGPRYALNGRMVTLIELSEACGIHRQTLYSRMKVVDCKTAIAKPVDRSRLLSRDDTSRPHRRRMVCISGNTMSLIDACSKHGINIGTVRSRMRDGWPEEQAIVTPVHKVTV